MDEELSAARSGAYILWRTEKTSYRSYSCSVALSDPGGILAKIEECIDARGKKEEPLPRPQLKE